MRRMGLLLAGLAVSMTPLCLGADEKADAAKVVCGKAVVKGGEAKIPFTLKLGKTDKSCEGVCPMVFLGGKAAQGSQAFMNLFAPKPGAETTKSYVFFPVKSGKSYEVQISMMYLDAAGETKYAKGTMKFDAP